MKTFAIIYNNEILIRKPGSCISYCISPPGQAACRIGEFSQKHFGFADVRVREPVGQRDGRWGLRRHKMNQPGRHKKGILLLCFLLLHSGENSI